MNQSKKIILNYIPPIRNVYPSAGLSILKSFLQQHGWGCKIIYWNILMDAVMQDFPYSDKRNLIPFLFHLAQQQNDEAAQLKIVKYICNQKTIYSEMKGFDYSGFLKNTISETEKSIDTELRKINFEEVLVFGISLKFYQFIPALFFAHEVKKRYPHIKIVIGGIRNAQIAREYMGMCRDFDFAIYGEGEYPLLHLCEYLAGISENTDKISRLLYRYESEILETKTAKKTFLDFKNYIFPDFSDYPVVNRESIIFAVNSVRSCYWDKCKFCIFGADYAYRERDPENIVEEIESLYQKYEISHFHFIDSDVIGTHSQRFMRLLDLLIESRKKLHVKYIFWAEVIHKNLSLDLFRKMELAGFTSASFGIESNCDSLLKKMNKRTHLADNFFALKNAVRFHIDCGGNMILNLPDETPDDIRECTANLHYLRFLFSDLVHPFSFGYRDFILQNGTSYYKELSVEEIEKHTKSNIATLLPESFFENRNRFNLFGYSRAMKHPNEWNEFKLMEAFYKKAHYSYSFEKVNDDLYFSETKNNKILYSLKLDKVILKILAILNEKIVSVDELMITIQKYIPDCNENNFVKALDLLKSRQLIYCSANQKAITSMVDTDRIV